WLNSPPAQVAVILLQLGLKAAEQRERICRGSSEPGEDLFLEHAPDLARIVLDDMLAKRDLAVSGHHDLIALANTKDGGRANFGKLRACFFSRRHGLARR